jgi:pimeloyl-ACP methyl ester carboxylesterase
LFIDQPRVAQLHGDDIVGGGVSTMPVFTHADGTLTAYDVTGEGPALLLIHGAEGSRRSFDRLVPLLANRFTVVTYDQRDCGETRNAAEPADLVHLAHDADELLTGLGHPKAFVFGTSFGGRVAQAAALLHPSRVERLILASTWALPKSLRDLNGEVAVAMSRLRDRLPESAEQLAEYFFPQAFLESHPQFRQHFARASARSERSERRAKTVGDVPALSPRDIAVPTLLLAGGADRLVPPALTTGMKDDIARSECAVLDGVGHITCVQAPQAVADRLRQFLS